MCKFVCPAHGEFKPRMVNYSCPLSARCPVCDELVDEEGGKIKVLSEEEARRKRPELYGEPHSDT